MISQILSTVEALDLLGIEKRITSLEAMPTEIHVGSSSSSSGGSSSSLSVIPVSSNYALSSSNDVVYATSSGITITLHDASTAARKAYCLKNLSGGNVSFSTTSSQTVDGSTGGTIVPNQSVDVVPDNVNSLWIIV